MKKLLLLSAVFILGCQSNAKYEEQDLVGSWTAIEWKDVTNDKLIEVPVGFEFDENSRYVGTYGEATEEGKYWISGDNLHTIEDGKAEKKVKINKLQNDTLILGMNRAGAIEELVLVKGN